MEVDTLTVVCVPFVSLILDMLRRAQARGVSAIKWSTERDVPRATRLLFVSYESVKTSKFMEYVFRPLSRFLL